MNTRQVVLVVVVTTVISTVATSLLGVAGVAAWTLTSLGLDRRYVYSATDLDLRGRHIRMILEDGNLEFEHSSGTGLRLNSYVIGTPRRTPVGIGVNDAQDVVELQVRGSARRTGDLQQWLIGGRVVAAVDKTGSLRLKTVRLEVRQVRGTTQLVAVFGDGTSVVLASGHPRS